MTLFYPKFYLRLGEAERNNVYVQDADGNWHDFSHYEYFKVKKGLNQVSGFEIKVYDIQDAEKVYFKEQAKIVFCSGTGLMLKGRVQTIEYTTGYECVAKGFGIEADLLDKELIKSNDKRVQYTNISAQTIAKEILSENTDGVTPWIVQPNSTGLFSSDYGNVSIRFEYANRLKALASLCEAIDYDWWTDVYQGEYIDYDDDYFKISSYKGSQSSVKTFNVTGANENCYKTFYEKDVNNLINHVTILGARDGVNQLKTSTYAASNTYSTLSSDITASSTTISLIDASSFASSGTVRIMEEQITYSGKSGDDLTGCSRGANSTTAKVHKKGVYIEKYYAYTSPETDSPIETYGLMEHTIIDRTFINEPTMELVATKYLLERKTVVERIKVMPDEPLNVVTEITTGDLVTVTDSQAGLSGDYRVVGIEYTSNWGIIKMEIELSNRKLEFIEQMQKQRDKEESMQKYMQGATNLYAVQSYENCDNTHPLNMRFYVPSEAVAINKVLLNFKMKDYRAYTTTSEVNSASSTVASSQSTATSVAINSNAWTNIVSITSANSDCEGIFLAFTAQLASTSTTVPSGSGRFSYRIYDGTNYYPVSTEANTIFGGYLWNDSPSLGGGISQYIPGNQKNKTFTLQMKWDGWSNDVDWVVNASANYLTASRHTHDIGYAIGEEGLTSPEVVIVAGTEGSEASVGTYNTDQTDLDITENITNVGAGNWINVKFTPNKRMRLEANIYCQIFLESK